MTIDMDNIFKSYNGLAVLEDFTLSIEDDRCYAIIGPEGCGKSTVLKIFMGMEKPDSGSVNRMGDYKYPTLRSAYVPQENEFKPRKNAVWHVKKVDRTIRAENAKEELGVFLTAEEMEQPMSELSDVKRRFVAIVKAMFVHADFIVLDEPFTGMTQEETDKAKEYILKKRGRRPLLISGKTEENLDFARKIYLKK